MQKCRNAERKCRMFMQSTYTEHSCNPFMQVLVQAWRVEHLKSRIVLDGLDATSRVSFLYKLNLGVVDLMYLGAIV